MAKDPSSSKAPNRQDSPTVYGGPTKRFFVSMLTRDIELRDAILDLVDNCVDGAMRQRRGKPEGEHPFTNFRADLKISKDFFQISDNCGGIPKDYVEDAFSLGRPNIAKDGDLPTIGMYGIGMKRAIFKIGNSASVKSNSSDGAFSVHYSSDWLRPDNDEWDLPILRSKKEAGITGVTIDIPDIKADIGRDFGNKAFLNALKNDISEHFGYLMQKGFTIAVNDAPLKPSTLNLYSAKYSTENDIRPYDFETIHDDVRIRVTVGLFRALVREAEIDDETESPKDTDKAGISIVCNDRVVVLSDQTMRTGWGDGSVPRYHPQFRAIAGLVTFSSNNADKLPISTTKRGLDASSEVYLLARKATMEGLKIFTDFTNKWKGMESETAEFFKAEKRADVRTEITLAKSHGTAIRGGNGAKKFVPTLPTPKSTNERRRISFIRDEKDIKKLSKYFFDDTSQHPSLVGGECFDRLLKEAKKR